MKVAIDTCSLLQLVRYYLPFDRNDILIKFLENRINSGEIIILDKVITECKRVSQGIILSSLTFLNEKKYITDTSNLIPLKSKELFNLLDNGFAIKSLCKNLSPSEYEAIKTQYKTEADFTLIVYCRNFKISTDSNLFPNTVAILTEETKSPDKKYFHKIPKICEHLGLETLTLPAYLSASNEISIDIVNKTIKKT